jgi:WD40 repeat protein
MAYLNRRLPLLVLAVAIFLAGCGQTTPPSSPASTAVTPPAPPVAEPATPFNTDEEPAASAAPFTLAASQPGTPGPPPPVPGGGKAYTGPLLAGEAQRFTGHTGAVTAVAIRTGTNELYSGGADGKLRQWDLSQGTSVRQFNALELAQSGRIAVSRNEPLVATAGFDGITTRLRIWDTASGEGRFIPVNEGGTASSLAPGALGRTVGAGLISGLAISTNGKRCFVCESPRRLFDFDPQADHAAGLQANLYPEGGFDDNPQEAASLALSGDGRLLATAGLVGQDLGTPQLAVKLWDTGTRQLRTTLVLKAVTSDAGGGSGRPAAGFGGGFTPYEGRIGGPGVMPLLRSVDVAVDGSRVMAGASDGTVYFWQLPAADDTNGKPPAAARRLKGHTGEVTAVAVLPGSQHGVSAGRDGTIRFWSLAGKGKEVAKIAAGADVLCLALGEGGKSIATGSAKGTVSVWSVPTLPTDTDQGEIPSPIAAKEDLPSWNDLFAIAQQVPATDGGGFEGVSGISWQPRSWTLTAKGPRALLTRPDGYVVLDAKNKSLFKHVSIPLGTGQPLDLPFGQRPKRAKKAAARAITGQLMAASLSDDGRRVVATIADPFGMGVATLLVAWDVERGVVVGQAELPGDVYVSQIIVSPTGQYALAGGPGSPTVVWNITKNTVGRGAMEIQGDCVRFSKDESRFLLVGRDVGFGAAVAPGIGSGGLRPGSEFGPGPGLPPAPQGGGGFAPEGEAVLGGLATAEVWDCDPLKRLNRFNASAGDVVAGALLSAKEAIVVGSDRTGAHELRVREVGSGRDLRQFAQPELDLPFTVTALALSPLGDYLATVGPGSNGFQLRLWDVAQGEECFLTESQQPWSHIAFASDGASLAALQDAGGTLWKLTPRAAAAVTTNTVSVPPMPMPTPASTTAQLRQWSDQSGKFKIEAQLIEVTGGNVRLRRADGRVVTVPEKMLSADDQKYLQELAPPSK